MCVSVSFELKMVVAVCFDQADFFVGLLWVVVLKRDNQLYCKLIKCFCILWLFFPLFVGLYFIHLRSFATDLSVFRISFCLSAFLLVLLVKTHSAFIVSLFYRTKILYRLPYLLSFSTLHQVPFLCCFTHKCMF